MVIAAIGTLLYLREPGRTLYRPASLVYGDRVGHVDDLRPDDDGGAQQRGIQPRWRGLSRTWGDPRDRQCLWHRPHADEPCLPVVLRHIPRCPGAPR